MSVSQRIIFAAVILAGAVAFAWFGAPELADRVVDLLGEAGQFDAGTTPVSTDAGAVS